MDNKPSSLPILTLARILWIAIGTSPLIFLLLLWVLENPPDAEGSAELSFSDPIVLVSCLASILIFILAQRVPSMFSRGEETDPQKILFPYLIRLALYEAIAIVGFLLSILKSSDIAYLPFLFISLAGFLSSSPHKSIRLGPDRQDQ